MRKLLYMVIVATMFVACQKENITQEGNADDLITFTSGVATRAINTMWEKNDMVGIYMFNSADNSVSSENIKYINNMEDGPKAEFLVFDELQTIYYPKAGDVYFIGYYPYSNNVVNQNYPVDVSVQDSQPIDLIIAKTEIANKDSGGQNLIFKHVLSNIVLNISAGVGMTDDDIKGVKVTVVGAETQASYNLVSEVFNNRISIKDIEMQVKEVEGKIATEAIVIPFNSSGNLVYLNFKIEGVVGDFRMILANANSGSRHTFNVELDHTGEVRLVSSTITDWETLEADSTPMPYIPIVNTVANAEDNSQSNLQTAMEAEYGASLEFRTTLRVSGTINQADFAYLEVLTKRSPMPLVAIDLSRTIVVGEIITSYQESQIGNAIPYDAFNGSANLTTFIYPPTITKIGGQAFFKCTGLAGDLRIPNAVTSIGNSAFYQCIGFNGTLTLPNTLTTIERAAFYGCSGFTGNLIIPNTVISIEGSVFFNCNGFNGTLSLSNRLTTIGGNAFYNCTNLTGDLIIPNTLTSIASMTFSGCRGFTGDLTIPNSVTTIEQQAFAGCSGLTGSLTIPDTVTEIELYAFYGCNALIDINVSWDGTEKIVPEVESNTFPRTFKIPGGGGTKSITIPSGVATSVYTNVAGWSTFALENAE